MKPTKNDFPKSKFSVLIFFKKKCRSRVASYFLTAIRCCDLKLTLSTSLPPPRCRVKHFRHVEGEVTNELEIVCEFQEMTFLEVHNNKQFLLPNSKRRYTNPCNKFGTATSFRNSPQLADSSTTDGAKPSSYS